MFYHNVLFYLRYAFLGGDRAVSKAALKQRKKREAKKTRKQEENSPNSPIKEAPVVSNVQISLTGDPEKDKKIKNIKKVFSIACSTKGIGHFQLSLVLVLMVLTTEIVNRLHYASC